MIKPNIVVLVPVTRDNYKRVIELCVAPDQEMFVGTTAEAIATAHFNPNYIMQAIVRISDAVFVGFLMYDPESPATIPPHAIRLERFLVDCKYQGRGYGRAALFMLKNQLKNDYPHQTQLQLVTLGHNQKGITFYEKSGFVFDPPPNARSTYAHGRISL